MNKLILIIVLLVSLVVIGQSIALVGGELSWIIHYENTTDEIPRDIISQVTYEYTCETDYFNWTLSPKIAYCYNQMYNSFNDTYDYPIIFQHSFDYGNALNKTIYWNVNEKTGTYIDYINTTTQERIGAMKDSRYLIFEDCEIMCGKAGDIVSCDSTRDGNGDGILQSGESGFTFNLNNVNWHNIKIKSDSVWFNKLRDCIVKT